MDGYSKSQIARNLVGFGRPVSAQQLIDGSPYAATLLFHDRIMPRKDLFFGFDWPQCLTSNGKCRGEALLTLVYAPPISDAYESELVRVNLEATLQQLDPVKAKYEKQGMDTFAGPDTAMGGAMERELIEDGLKWCIVKQVKFAPTRAVGKSSDWRIVVRDGRASLEIPTRGGQASEQGREVFQPSGNQILHVTLSLPRAVDRHQSRLQQLLALRVAK